MIQPAAYSTPSLFDRWETMERTFFPNRDFSALSLQPMGLETSRRRYLLLEEVTGYARILCDFIHGQLGEKLYSEFVRVIKIDNRIFIHLGEIHGQKRFLKLHVQFMNEAKHMRVICLHEGVIRHPGLEVQTFSKPIGYNFGLEDLNQPTLTPIISYHRSIIGTSNEQKDFQFSEAELLYADLQLHRFSPRMMQLWPDVLKETNTLSCKALAEETYKLVQASLVRPLPAQTAASLQKFSKQDFQLFYWVMTKHCLNVIPLSSQARRDTKLWMTLPPCKYPLPNSVSCETRSGRRDATWAQNVVSLLPQLPPGLPIVSSIGIGHLDIYTDELLQRLPRKIHWPWDGAIPEALRGILIKNLSV